MVPPTPCSDSSYGQALPVDGLLGPQRPRRQGKPHLIDEGNEAQEKQEFLKQDFLTQPVMCCRKQLILLCALGPLTPTHGSLLPVESFLQAVRTISPCFASLPQQFLLSPSSEQAKSMACLKSPQDGFQAVVVARKAPSPSPAHPPSELTVSSQGSFLALRCQQGDPMQCLSRMPMAPC